MLYLIFKYLFKHLLSHLDIKAESKKPTEDPHDAKLRHMKTFMGYQLAVLEDENTFVCNSLGRHPEQLYKRLENGQN